MSWVDVHPGQRREREIQKALEESTHLLLIHTKAANEDDDTLDEWLAFRKRNKPIIPLIYENVPLSYKLENFQFIDFCETPYEQAVECLKAALIYDFTKDNNDPDDTPPGGQIHKKSKSLPTNIISFPKTPRELGNDKTSNPSYLIETLQQLRQVIELILQSIITVSQSSFRLEGIALKEEWEDFARILEKLPTDFDDLNEITNLRDIISNILSVTHRKINDDDSLITTEIGLLNYLADDEFIDLTNKLQIMLSNLDKLITPSTMPTDTPTLAPTLIDIGHEVSLARQQHRLISDVYNSELSYQCEIMVDQARYPDRTVEDEIEDIVNNAFQEYEPTDVLLPLTHLRKQCLN